MMKVPWSKKDRQSFADGDKLRASRVSSRHKPAPEADEWEDDNTFSAPEIMGWVREENGWRRPDGLWSVYKPTVEQMLTWLHERYRFIEISSDSESIAYTSDDGIVRYLPTYTIELSKVYSSPSDPYFQFKDQSLDDCLAEVIETLYG